MNYYMKFLLLASVILTNSACSINADSPNLLVSDAASQTILIQGVDIFSGRDSVIIRHKDVLIANGFIKSIKDRIEARSDYTLIKGKGKTLMPGLIDSHVHLSGSGAVPWDNQKANIHYNLQAYLYAGITTIYDLGGLAGDLEKIANKLENQELIGPSVFHTHIPITVKNSHPIPLTEVMLFWPLKNMVNSISPTIDKPSEAAKLIEKYVGKNTDYVKVICDQIPPGSPQMTFEQLEALVQEAHKVHQKVIVHIGSPENAITAIKAGADVLAHGVWRGKLSLDQAQFIANSKVPIIYTISGFKNVAEIHHGEFEPNDLDKKLVPKKVLDPVTGAKGMDVHCQEVMHEFFEDVAAHSTYWEHNFKLLYQMGAPILVGTDSNLPGTYAGSTYFQELTELKNYGMSNFDILYGATYGNAVLFLDKPNFGSVEENQKADLLLLKGNPIENLEILRDPQYIFKSGRIVKRLK
ncbi:MAG: amidohydrolase family protein [Bacteroidetes bacterium]|nr:amidohydrolase family protein [Bacteroidota bacterium]